MLAAVHHTRKALRMTDNGSIPVGHRVLVDLPSPILVEFFLFRGQFVQQACFGTSSNAITQEICLFGQKFKVHLLEQLFGHIGETCAP